MKDMSFSWKDICDDSSRDIVEWQEILVCRGWIVQICAAPLVLLCCVLCHGCGMRSFISPLHHYVASLCKSQRGQWFFETIPELAESSFASARVFAHLLFCAESRHSALRRQRSSQIVIFFLILLCYWEGWREHAVEILPITSCRDFETNVGCYKCKGDTFPHWCQG